MPRNEFKGESDEEFEPKIFGYVIDGDNVMVSEESPDGKELTERRTVNREEFIKELQAKADAGSPTAAAQLEFIANHVEKKR